MFDVVGLPLPYNGILGRTALAKFMVASNYAYNTLKMPGPLGFITIPSDEMDAIICLDKMYRDAIVAEAVVAPAKERNWKNRECRDFDKESRKRAPTECTTPVDDVSECCNSKKFKVTAPEVKEILAGLAGVDGTFTISATLDDK